MGKNFVKLLLATLKFVLSTNVIKKFVKPTPKVVIARPVTFWLQREGNRKEAVQHSQGAREKHSKKYGYKHGEEGVDPADIGEGFEVNRFSYAAAYRANAHNTGYT